MVRKTNNQAPRAVVNPLPTDPSDPPGSQFDAGGYHWHAQGSETFCVSLGGYINYRFGFAWAALIYISILSDCIMLAT
ncbi:unnamed protein product [Toxocara canis]|uniref:Sodium-and chloride-dependent glycine transporter 2 n=1 Tax=Toxocara canis TaxID=6265 RepID=A0A183UMT1_TOXCA|nr:unnamed protein product [Toxocara canis]